MLGPSRKRFIGELTAQTEPARRAAGTIGACLEGWRRGATLFRVHDVGEVVSAFAVVRAIAGR
jgi:dihydropteroate synthase